MTTFGSLIDKQSIASTVGLGDAPVEPTLFPDAGTQITSVGKKPRPLDDDDADRLTRRWRNSVTQARQKAQAFVVRYPDSMTARARLADTAYVANDVESALEAAVGTLALAVRRLSADSQQVVDTPAAYMAVQVLLRLNKTESADKYLPSLTSIPALAQVWASILARRSQLDEALDIVSSLDSDIPGVAGLRGYIHILRREYGTAVSQLRLAQRLDPRDVDALLNLASALWHLGSSKKAVQWARYATRVAPGRSDAVMALFHYLTETHQFAVADAEVRALKEKGVIETAPLLLVQARLALGLGKRERVSALLRRARVLASEEGNEPLTAELDGRIAIFQYVSDEIDRLEALRRVRSALRRAPDAPVLVAMLADLTKHSSGATEVRKALEAIHREEVHHPVLQGTMCRLAFLEGRFDDAYRLISRWVEDEPNNDRAVGLWTFWHGSLLEDWSTAADRILSAISRLGVDQSLANTAAYALALSGRGAVAESVLDRVDTSSYFLKATRGLVKISIGEVERGLTLYRQAAQLADREKDGSYLRCFMTIHQAMALRRLGVMERNPEQIRAGALPPVPLPTKWEELSDFLFLAEVARRRGWHWPVMIE